MGQVGRNASAASAMHQWLTRAYATPWVGKACDAAIVAAFFALADMNGGNSVGWPVLLLLRASAWIPFFLTFGIGIAQAVAGASVVGHMPPWAMLAVAVSTFAAVNAANIRHQTICMFAGIAAGLLLMALWNVDGVWPTRAIVISLIAWGVSTFAGIIFVEFRGLLLRVRS